MIIALAVAALATQPLAAHAPGEHLPVAPARAVQNTEEVAVRAMRR